MSVARPTQPLIPNAWATAAGVIPVRSGPVRFAVGDPNGLTSNSWRMWTTKNGDLYIKCRDNFRETKVSLHTSGRWRMGFTTEALSSGPTSPHFGDKNRAWEVWDEPPPRANGLVNAFRLLFPTSELAVAPEQRSDKDWSGVIFVEASPSPDKIVAISLFIAPGEPQLSHPSEQSFQLASLPLPKGRRAQLIAHSAPIADLMNLIAIAAAKGREMAAKNGVSVPDTAYGYFLGRTADGARYIVGARIHRG